MGIEQMRSYVSDAYPGTSWKNKVAKMKDNQVIAIYYRLIEAERSK